MKTQREYKRRAPQAREMSGVESAWIGAMVDAEGTARIARGSKGDYEWFQPRISVVNTEVEIMSALLRATGVGHVYPKQPSGGVKPIWVWQLDSYNDVVILLRQLLPYSIKAQQLLERL